MAAKPRHRRVGNRRKKKLDYERFERGPFVVERLGRAVIQRFNMDPEDHRRFRQEVWESRPEQLREFESARDELLHILRCYSPLALLQDTFIRNCLGFNEPSTKLRDDRVEAYLEYLLNLVMAINFGDDMVEPDRKICDRVAALLKKAFHSAMIYFASEAARPDAQAIDELRFEAISRALFLRGASYTVHHLALVRAVFEPHDERIIQRLGFTTGELLAAAKEIERQVEAGVRATPAWFEEMTALHDQFKSWVESEESNEEGIADLLERFLSSQEVSEAMARADKLLDQGALNMMMLSPGHDLPPRLLSALALQPGENAAFLQPPVSGSPLNRGGAHSRPLLKIGSDFFAFSPSMLYRNLEPILLQAFEEGDGTIDNRFFKARHDVVLDFATRQFEKLLPGCSLHRNLFYRPNPTRSDRMLEVDLIVIFEKYLFIVEGKAGGFSEEAQRGSLVALQSKFDELVLKAFEQLREADQYIQNADTADFLDQQGEVVLQLRPDTWRRRFQICVTLTEIGYLTAQLGHLQKLGAVPEGALPWAVFVNDLQVISEVLESPSDFLLYLDRRLSIQGAPQLRIIDELDYFMYFVERGLYLEEELLHRHTSIRFEGFTTDLDRYYLSLEGKIDPVGKPTRKVHPVVRQLAFLIESLLSQDRYEVSTFLLGLDGDAQDELAQTCDLLRAKLARDGKSHGVSWRFNSESTGLSLVVGPSSERSWIKLHHERNLIRKYQAKQRKCICIYIAYDASFSIAELVVNLLESEWRPSESMERRLTEFQLTETKQAIANYGIPGRNDPCPCGSGLKFKKCCLLTLS